MFGSKAFFAGLAFLSSFTSVNSLSCISMNNEECNVRSHIFNFNGDDLVFYPFRITTSKCSSSCNNINDPYGKMCVLGVIKNLNVKVFNLVPRTNETRHMEWHETCKCKCRLCKCRCKHL